MDFILKSKIVKNLLIFQLEFSDVDSSDIDISLIQKFYSSYDKAKCHYSSDYVNEQYWIYNFKIKSLKNCLYWSANYVYTNAERRVKIQNDK